MVNYFRHNCHIFFACSKNGVHFYRCLHLNKKEEVLLLKSPKLVYSLTDLNSSKYKSNISIQNSFVKIEDRTIDLALNNKYDKKNKSHSKQEDDLEARKNKIKFKKKTRNKMSLDKKNLFIANNAEQVFSDDVLDENLIRQPKNSRNKRKAKEKQGFLNSKLNKIDLNHEEVLNKDIVIDSPLTIQELAIKLHIPEAEIITWLFLQGISVTVNQSVDISIATKVAKHYSFNIIDSLVNPKINGKKNYNILPSNMNIERAPVVTIFGHIDHGKTTLLDTIRSTKIVNNESGGITQSIAAYEVTWVYNSKKEKLVFIDTPGHEAFIGMRSRGAQVTDIAVLVVAADDGLKPQTIEAIKHIKNNKLACIVAINKIDKPNINILKVKEDLAEFDLLAKEWGGNTNIIEISALKNLNIDILLSSICIIAKKQNLKASSSDLAQGTILEAYLDRTKGPIANILVQNGRLNIGDIIISESITGRVKALINCEVIKINYAEPSSVIQVWGFSSVPQAGSEFKIVRSEKEAKHIVNECINQEINNRTLKSLNTRVTIDLDNNSEISVKPINLIIKANTQGSIEAIIHSLSQIPQEKVQLNILFMGSGNISDKDINLAITSNSILIAFNLNISQNLENEINKSGIILNKSKVIYDLLNFIRNHMLNFVEPEYDKLLIGTASVQTVFEITKGSVAGCIVNTGKLKKNSSISIYRQDMLVYDGTLDSLKRSKDDVEEVLESHECGVMCYNYHFWQKGDTIKVYQMNEKQKTL